jgi:hypothetical protein
MKALVACHVHSEWSYDGSWKLEELAEFFSGRGYRAVMMTEHDRGFSERRWKEFRESCAKASSEQILLVPGIEYSDPENRVHVLIWGSVPFLGEGLSTKAVLQAAHAAGGFAVFAHPSRREAWKLYEPEWAHYLSGIETWNRKYDGWAPCKSAPELLEKSRALPFVGLDFHTIRQAFPLGMMLEIESKISESSILDALRSGRCQPEAFGFALKHAAAKSAIPVLRMVERGRKTAASILKRKASPAKKSAPPQ